jgi:hypothetical protein
LALRRGALGRECGHGHDSQKQSGKNGRAAHRNISGLA